MRKIVHLILFIFLIVVAKAGTVDTVYTEEAALAVYDYNPERALAIIDSAEIIGNLEKNHANFLRSMVYSKSLAGQQFDKAQRILEVLMDSDYVANPENREAVIDLLINISRRHGDNERLLSLSKEKVELCMQRGEETEALRTEAEIGMVLAQLGDVEKGIAKLNGVIGTLDEQRHFNEMDACIIAIKRKINVLDQIGKPADIMPLAQRIINKINDYREHSDEYDDGSFRMPPTPEQFKKYCNFYTAQAYGFLAKAYADLGITNTAICYVELFEESDYGKTYSGRMMISSTWCKLGQFDKMLAVYDEATERLGSDTLNIDYVTVLYGRAMAAAATGNYNAASNYWQRYSKLINMLNMKQQASQAYHYAARYHLQEERQKTEQEQAKAHNNMLMAIIGFILFVMAAIFIVWLLVQRKSIKRKNNGLIDQNTESVKSDKKPQTPEPKPDVNKMDDKQLFAYLSDIIRREQLFLDQSFGRQVLVDRFKISERRVGAAFSCCNGLPDFVRDLRLEYACKLFAEQPDMSVNDVAVASGFSNNTVFGRDFKRKYGVTPTQYRSQIKAKK